MNDVDYLNAIEKAKTNLNPYELSSLLERKDLPPEVRNAMSKLFVELATSTAFLQNSLQVYWLIIDARRFITKVMKIELGKAYLEAVKKLFTGKGDDFEVRRLFEIYQLVEHKRVPKELKNEAKSVFQEAAKKVLDGAVSNGQWKSVLYISSRELVRFARWREPELYALVTSAKEKLALSIQTSIQLSVQSGNVSNLVDILTSGEISFELKKLANEKLYDSVAAYLQKRIDDCQTYNSSITGISQYLTNKDVSKGCLDPEKWQPIFADLVLKHLESVIALPSDKQAGTFISTAATVCIEGLTALNAKHMEAKKQQVISLLENAYNNPTETRKGVILEIIEKWARESEKRYYSGYSVHDSNSMYHLASKALERIKTAQDKLNPPQQNGSQPNGTRLRV